MPLRDVCLQPRILILLRRCLFDNDDEVRDRATLYLNVLGGDGAEISVAGDEEDGAKKFMLEELDVPLQNLEAALKAYVSAAMGLHHCIWLAFTGHKALPICCRTWHCLVFLYLLHRDLLAQASDTVFSIRSDAIRLW